MQGGGDQERARPFGGYSGRRRGEGGEEQRKPDNGWEGRKAGMGTGGNKVNGNKQAENHKQSNMFGVGSFNRDKDIEGLRQQGGRKYKQAVQKDAGASQTTLNEFWKGKGKDMRTWSEEMEELEELDCLKAKNSQESILSYV